MIPRLLVLLTFLTFAGRAPAQSPETLSDPGTMSAYASKTGRTFLVQVTGTTSGTIYGTRFYTTDSKLATAAVHAGVLRDGETDVVAVTILRGRSRYDASTAHGVTSSAWGTYPSCYRVARPGDKGIGSGEGLSPEEMGAPPQAPANLSTYTADAGTLTFTLRGDRSGGTVWGTDIYTNDSSLGAAAVHAGVLRHGQVGPVKVRLMPGRSSYPGSAQNGVTSSDYGAWQVSFEFVRE